MKFSCQIGWTETVRLRDVRDEDTKDASKPTSDGTYRVLGSL